MNILLSERLNKIGSDIMITDYVGNIVDLLINKPQPYKIIYDAQADYWIIAPAFKYIHQVMMDKAWRDGWYTNQEDFLSIFCIGRIDHHSGVQYFQAGVDIHDCVEEMTDDQFNLISDRVETDECYVYNWLYCLVFIPNTMNDYESRRITYGDGYGYDYDLPTGKLFTRGFELYDLPELEARVEDL